MKTEKYKIEPSIEPNEDGSHILFRITETPHGSNYRRIYKGSFKDCKKEKERIEKMKKEII